MNLGLLPKMNNCFNKKLNKVALFKMRYWIVNNKKIPFFYLPKLRNDGTKWEPAAAYLGAAFPPQHTDPPPSSVLPD